MSLGNDCRVPDPTDKIAADQFQPNHRAGYQSDKLAFLMQWLTDHPDATLASGEGRVLRDEINRLRACVERVRAMEGQALDDDVYDFSGGWIHVNSLRHTLDGPA
jgi:hypothetical protein